MTGVIKSGKDHKAQIFLSLNPHAQLVNFADPLRKITWKLIGCETKTPEQYEIFKKQPVKIDKYNLYFNTGRDLLKFVGDILNIADKDYFIKQWEASVESFPAKDIITTDARSPDEIRAVYKLKGKVIFCNYPSKDYNCTDTHVTEQMAQKLLSHGFRHNDIIEQAVFECIFNE